MGFGQTIQVGQTFCRGEQDFPEFLWEQAGFAKVCAGEGRSHSNSFLQEQVGFVRISAGVDGIGQIFYFIFS